MPVISLDYEKGRQFARVTQIAIDTLQAKARHYAGRIRTGEVSPMEAHQLRLTLEMLAHFQKMGAIRPGLAPDMPGATSKRTTDADGNMIVSIEIEYANKDIYFALMGMVYQIVVVDRLKAENEDDRPAPEQIDFIKDIMEVLSGY